MEKLKQEQELLKDGFRKENVSDMEAPCWIATMWSKQTNTYEVAYLEDQKKLEDFLTEHPFKKFYFKKLSRIKPGLSIVDTVRVGGTDLDGDSPWHYFIDLLSDGSTVWRQNYEPRPEV